MQVAHLHSGSSSTWFLVEFEFGNVGFWGEGKTGVPGKNLLEQGREPTTNSSHMWHCRRDLNPGYIGGRRVLSPLRHPCSPLFLDKTEAQRAEKFFLGMALPSLSLGQDDHLPPLISRSGSSTAISTSKCQPCMYLLLWSHKYRAVNTISSCCVYDTGRWGIKQVEGNMFGSIFLQFSCKSRQGHVHNSWGKLLAPGP